MNRKLIALAAALGVMCSMLTACGDDADSSEDTAASVSTEDTEASSDETSDSQASTEAPTEKQTTTEKATIAVPTSPEKITDFDANKMIGSTAGDVVKYLGDDCKIDTDAGAGTYVLYNTDALESTEFFFTDHQWDGQWNENGDNSAILSGAANSTAKITKINITDGKVDDFTVGMLYSDCAEIIGAFPTSAGDMGSTMCGAPASLVYYYKSNVNKDCIVGLHFELTGELDRNLNEGKYNLGKCCDILAGEMEKYDPKLALISVIYAPEIDINNRKTTTNCSSQLKDITNNGKTYTYGVENTFDGDLSTCWCEGENDPGMGQYIYIFNPDLANMRFVTIYGGLLSDKESFYKNCRPERVSIFWHNEPGSEYVLLTDFDQPYRRAIPYAQGDEISIGITQVNENGVTYKDTCISEIKFNG
ncbi:MAG: hypothetical protein IKO47_04915 [Ruminococcus sp.]|nr:hypothetical protein [Ruminococcus sp.]